MKQSLNYPISPTSFRQQKKELDDLEKETREWRRNEWEHFRFKLEVFRTVILIILAMKILVLDTQFARYGSDTNAWIAIFFGFCVSLVICPDAMSRPTK